jgi:hypothetical protein
MGKKKPYVTPRLTQYDPKNIQSDTRNPSTARLLICDDNPNIRYPLRAYAVRAFLPKVPILLLSVYGGKQLSEEVQR